MVCFIINPISYMSEGNPCPESIHCLSTLLLCKGICKPILNGFFEDFIINVINEALEINKELHENGIDSNDVIQRITRQAHVRLIEWKSVGGIWIACRVYNSEGVRRPFHIPRTPPPPWVEETGPSVLPPICQSTRILKSNPIQKILRLQN